MTDPAKPRVGTITAIGINADRLDGFWLHLGESVQVIELEPLLEWARFQLEDQPSRSALWAFEELINFIDQARNPTHRR